MTTRRMFSRATAATSVLLAVLVGCSSDDDTELTPDATADGPATDGGGGTAVNDGSPADGSGGTVKNDGGPDADATPDVVGDVIVEAGYAPCEENPTAPANLKPGAGTQLAKCYHAVGVQIYTCQALGDGGAVDAGDAGDAGAGYSWSSAKPEADLFDNAAAKKGTHYFYTPEAGASGPAWKSTDNSLVEGKRIADAPNPDGTSIPYLLLQGVAHEGSGVLSSVTYIQRLATKGGIAPSAADCGAAQVGTVRRVDYTANYYFYTGTPSDAGDGSTDAADGSHD